MAPQHHEPTRGGPAVATPVPDTPAAGLLILGAGLSLVLLLGMVALDRSLKTPAAPAGIISFELAGSPAAAEEILASWDPSARIKAGISLGLDFFFLAAYAFTLAGVSRHVAGRLPPRFRRLRALGGLMAKGAWLAGGLDVVENLALIQLLTGNDKVWLPVLAAWCAWPKFSLAACALTYIGAGAVVLIVRGKGRWNPF